MFKMWNITFTSCVWSLYKHTETVFVDRVMGFILNKSTAVGKSPRFLCLDVSQQLAAYEK